MTFQKMKANKQLLSLLNHSVHLIISAFSYIWVVNKNLCILVFLDSGAFNMANYDYEKTVQDLLNVDGALACAVVDYASGMMLSGSGSSNIDLEVAAAGNTEVMRSIMKTMDMLGMKDSIEDILITLGKQYHLMRPVVKIDGLFLYSILDRSKSNLALARRALLDAERELVS